MNLKALPKSYKGHRLISCIIDEVTNYLITVSTGLGQMWPKYLPLAMFAYNAFKSPNLANYSLY